MAAPSAGTGKQLHLEAARGIASVVVVIHHVHLAFAPALQVVQSTELTVFNLFSTLALWVTNGTSAVFFFFTLSGYVLTRKYFLVRDPASIGRAVVKRLPRLMLPATLSILLSFFFFKLRLFAFQDAAALTGSDWLQSFAHGNLPQNYHAKILVALKESVLTFFDGKVTFNTNLWTIRLEFWGSCIAFGLALTIAAALQFRFVAYVLVLAAVAIGFAQPFLVPFVAGVGAATLGRERPFSLPAWTAVAITAIGIYLLGYAPEYAPFSLLDFLKVFFRSPGEFSVYVNTAGSVMIILGLNCSPWLARHLSGRAGRVLGVYSFPLYLVHTIVILSLSSAFFLDMHQVLSPNWLLAATLAVTLAISALLATPFVWVETRWIAMLNAAAIRFVPRTPRPEAAQPVASEPETAIAK